MLAEELSKLPEIQDGISESDVKALERLAELHTSNPEDFNNAFDKMYQVGKPDVRKYCTPLQALYWLFEDNKIDEATSIIIRAYNIESLLSLSWGNSIYSVQTNLSEKDLVEIATKHVTDANIDNRYGRRTTTYKTNIENYLSETDEERKKDMFDTLKSVILLDYTANKSRFNREGRKIIKDSIIEIKDDRWDDFSMVVDRLNSPKLVKIYLYGFSYRTTYFPQKAEVTFNKGIGDCKAYAIFSYHCLSRAGYRVSLYTMDPRSMAGHTICIYKHNGEYYALDNTRGLSGPFISKVEIKKSFGFGGKDSLTENIASMYTRFH